MCRVTSHLALHESTGHALVCMMPRYTHVAVACGYRNNWWQTGCRRHCSICTLSCTSTGASQSCTMLSVKSWAAEKCRWKVQGIVMDWWRPCVRKASEHTEGKCSGLTFKLFGL